MAGEKQAQGSSSKVLLKVMGGTVVVAVLVFYVAPFFVLGWSRAPFLLRLNDHFVMNGTMSLTTVARLFRDPILLTG